VGGIRVWHLLGKELRFSTSIGSEEVMLTLLNESALRAAPLHREPYEHVLIDDSVKRTYEASILADAPRIGAPGSFALSSVRYGPGFAALIAELKGEGFRRIVESKLGIDLHDYPTMITVRGYCNRERDRDGYIHTDSRQKIVTVLLYLNGGWAGAGGSLRVLRSRHIDDYALEITPEFGRMLIFRRCDHSWHARVPYEGPRLNLQVNWVVSRSYVRRELLKHRLSAFAKHFALPREILGRLPRLRSY
jgi:SM-20-related protein